MVSYKKLRMPRQKPIQIWVNPEFYNKLRIERSNMSKGLMKSVSYPELTAMLGKSNFKFPRINYRRIYGTKKNPTKKR
jgi:hypothetical protein